MSNIQSLSFDALSRREPSLGRPKVFIPANKAENEDMMLTDDYSATAGTPPLDLGSDSGEDDSSELSTRSPCSPSSFPPPVSILHLRKRKDSQEHLSPVHLFDHNQEPQEQGKEVDYRSYAPSAAPRTIVGAQGRRPTVTFEMDSVTPLQPRHCHFRHDDDDEGEESGTDGDGYDNDDDDDVPESLILAEQALRRVSLAPLNESNSEAKLSTNKLDFDVPLAEGGQCVLNATASKTGSTTTKDATLASSTTLAATTEDSTACVAPKEILLNHILAEPAPQDMLVALFDRPCELEALAAFHSDFFLLMYASVASTNRQAFRTLLFKTRSELCDRDWMQALASEQYLQGHPCLLEKFKSIVGWIGPDSFNCDGDDNDSDTSDLQLWGEDEYGCRDSSFEQVQIKWFRDLEDFPIEVFERYYPQFFINARDKLQGRRMSHGGDARDQYLVFRETLQLSRKDLACDNAWARRMNGCLEKHPELLLQLKEIIAYEVGYDD